MKKRCLAFVLSGGGGRGAMQVGALRALLEADIFPDLLVGSSIGAVNSAGLALWGPDLDGVAELEKAWDEIAGLRLMDQHFSQWMLRALLSRSDGRPRQRVIDFFESLGFNRGLRFNQIPWVRLGLVGADLESGQMVIYGQDPSQTIIEGLLASIALPPWFPPVETGCQKIVDGGALSNLPVEPALALGATEIIALDLLDMPGEKRPAYSANQWVVKYFCALNRRHFELELALAQSQGVAVHYMALEAPQATPIWDFSSYKALIRAGYDAAVRQIAASGVGEALLAEQPELSQNLSLPFQLAEKA